MMMLNRLSRRGLSSSAAAFTTPHGLFAALTPTRRVLAVELWPVEGVVTCAVSDEYLGNSTTLEALGDEWAYVEWMRSGFPLSKVVGVTGGK